MIDRTQPDSAAAAEQARIRAEQQREAAARAAEQAKAAEEAAEAGAKKPESHHLDAAAAKFRGEQSESTFDAGGGKRRAASTQVRAGAGARTETTRRRTTTSSGGTAEYYARAKSSAATGNTTTSKRTRVTTAQGASRSTSGSTTGATQRSGSAVDKRFGANLASTSQSVGNADLASGSTTLPGGVAAQGSVTGPGAAFSASARAGLSGGDLKVGVDVKVDAHALEAQGSVEKDVTFKVGDETFKAKVKLGANAEIGADGTLHLDLDIGLHGAKVEVGASGFAGASGSLTGEVELDQVKGGVDRELLDGAITGTATAGVAGSANFSAGISDGKFGFHAKASLAVGVGLGVEVTGDVNLGNTASAIKDVALDEGVQVAQDVAADAAGAGKAVYGGMQDLGNLELRGLGTMWSATTSGAAGLESAAASGLHTATHAASSAYDNTVGKALSWAGL